MASARTDEKRKSALARRAVAWGVLTFALGTPGIEARAGSLPSDAGPDRFGLGEALHLAVELRPMLLDYELPGHPNALGRGHAGLIGSAALVWRYDRSLSVEAGVLARLPFALSFEDELGAFPLIAVVAHPFGPDIALRFGALKIDHGFHPGVLDEDRFSYGRDVGATYNQSLRADARRNVDPHVAMPVENGVQLLADVDGLHTDVFLDWQLLETPEHREKFAVGVLSEYRSRYVDAGFQLRLVHYGGQLYTQSDPIRRAGLDNKRQPTTLAFAIRPRPVQTSWLTIELPAAFLQGRMIQEPGGAAQSHGGLELGADVLLFEVGRLGYRIWLPKDGEARALSEDGDPVYSGPRAHRAILGVDTEHGAYTLSGRLDLVIARGSDKVQYEAVTTLTLRWEKLLWADLRLP